MKWCFLIIIIIFFFSDWSVCWFLRAALHSAEVQLGWTMYPLCSVLHCVVVCVLWVESLTCASAVEECSENGCLALSLLELLALNMMFIFISSVLVLIEVRTSQANMFKNKVITRNTRGKNLLYIYIYIFFFFFSCSPMQHIFNKNTVIILNVNNIKMFLEQQISMLEWFLKDHVTLKTGVMMLKIQLWSQE